MTRIRADRRKLDWVDRPAKRAQAVQRLQRVLQDKVSLAELFRDLDRHRSFRADDCASIGEYGARHGMHPAEAFELCSAGHAFARIPALKGEVLAKKVSLKNAAQIGRIARKEDGIPEGQEGAWIAIARNSDTGEVKKHVEHRQAEMKQSSKRPKLVEVACFIEPEAKNDFDRCKVLESRKQRKVVSDSDMLPVLCTTYLDLNDPARSGQGKRKRRKGETGKNPQDRTVPAQVDRALLERSDDKCEFPGCTQAIWTERCHREANARGGSQEIDNLFRGCRDHHVMHDAGRIRLLGFTPQGRGIFAGRDGAIYYPGGSEVPSWGVVVWRVRPAEGP